MDVSAKIITQFVKDLSFENPMGPGAFQQGSERPAINANVDVKATNRKDTDIYEVELNINISAKREDKNVYIIDLKYTTFRCVIFPIHLEYMKERMCQGFCHLNFENCKRWAPLKPFG